MKTVWMVLAIVLGLAALGGFRRNIQFTGYDLGEPARALATPVITKMMPTPARLV